MRLNFGLLGALALTACSPAGQSPLTAAIEGAPVTAEAGAPANPDAAGFSAFAPLPDSGPQAPGALAQGGPGLFGMFAPKPAAPQAAEIVPPGDFQAPENPPLPAPRPDFGDRPVVTAAAIAPLPEPVPAPVAPAAPAAPAAAAARSLAAYEMQEAGMPPVSEPEVQPEGETHPRMEGFNYVPANFQVAGAPPAEDPALRAPLRGQSSNGLSFEQGPRRWRAAYDNVETNCFPQRLRQALDAIGKHFGAEVLVTSGARDRGRRGSLHRSCKAADVRIAGVSPKAVADFARTVPGVNGVGTYRWVAVTHVDVRDERFAWRW